MIRAIDKWLPGYLGSLFRGLHPSRPFHLLFCLADHHEPFRGGADKDSALAIVRRWEREWPALAGRFTDADGRHPSVSLFYPEEEYDRDVVDVLAGLTQSRLAEVEVQMHHRHDTPQGVREKLLRFCDRLRTNHGCLGHDEAGRLRFGFVHGNWALCNSRPDGDWCGVNEELGLLKDLGCYADFTFPSAPSPTQPGMVNRIYRAKDRPGQPRGHDEGRDVAVGSQTRDGLMLITGPLCPLWSRRKWGILPRVENGEISGANPPGTDRLRAWVSCGIHVKLADDWMVVKVHTHGCVEANADVVLGAPMAQLFAELVSSPEWKVHFVSARELYNIVRAAEDGHQGNPGDFRDYEIALP